MDGSTIVNFTTMIMQAILANGIISNLNFISKKLMSFSDNGVNV
jgi:hypothetical protein